MPYTHALSGEHEALRRKLSWNGPPPTAVRFLSVFMDQNNRCNLKCRMCGFSDARVDAVPKYDMPAALFAKIAAEILPRASYVCLSIMTEPFMTRAFPERLACVRDAGVPFSDIITNGTLLDDAKIEKILDAEITRLTFSIDGGTKEIFEAIRTGARFETVLANVRLFQMMRASRGTKLRINHVLSEPNIDHFGRFLDLVEEIAPEEIAVRTVSRMSDAEIQESRDLRFWAKVRNARRELATFCARTGIADSGYLRDRHSRIEVAGMMCRVPWLTIAIHPNGDVFPCMAWSRPPIGNLQHQSFDEIWNGEPLAEVRREFEATRPGVDCLHCRVRRDPGDVRDDFFFEKLARQE